MPARRLLRARNLLALVGVAVLSFLAGPRARVDPSWHEPGLPATLPELVTTLEALELGVSGLRPGDGMGIVWADPSEPTVTPLALVYLHGFSADRHEVEPLLTDLGDRLGANVFFTRLHGHGRDASAMADAAAEDWLDDAARAVAVGARIGERVVLVGTSTGGTLATWAAARPEAAGRVDALVLISPNFGVADASASALLLPWGGTIARLVVGPERCFEPENDAQARHWTTCYPTSALPPMLALVDHVRSMDLSTVEVPVLVLMHPDDRVVDAARTLRVVDRLTGTDPVVEVIEETSDPSRHVLAGEIVSPASTDVVRDVILDFLEARGLRAAG